MMQNNKIYPLITTLSILLPTHRTLPKSLEDGENFGRGEKMFDFPCLTKAGDEDDDEAERNVKDVEIAQISRVASKVDATSTSEASTTGSNTNETSRL